MREVAYLLIGFIAGCIVGGYAISALFSAIIPDSMKNKRA